MLCKCPPQEDLLAFHLGTLAESAVDALGEHLEECPDCEAILQRFEDSSDPFFVALRHPAAAERLKITTTRQPNEASEHDTTFVMQTPSLPGYEILDPLGHGGMGTVYKARQIRLNRGVALKQLSCIRDRDLTRARREAEALARLQHPNIVQIFEILEHEGRVYLALELVEGGPLSARLDGKPQPAAASAQLVETLARAIHYAHQRGIVHRDLKPSNVLLAQSQTPANHGQAVWSGFLPKITDFGIAKQLSRAEGETREGDVIGTPSYMAPEQAGGEPSLVGPAADVYSLGVLLYELLTGRVPLLDTNVLSTLLRVRNEEPVPPRRLQPRLPRDLETICLKCLRKEPHQRYADAEQLADDLHRFLTHEPIRARPTPTWEHARKWIRRHPGIAALTALLVLVAVLGFSLVAWQWRRAEDKADDEARAKQLAQDRGQREKETRLQIQKLVAHNSLSEGINLCQHGETARGLLWMVRALALAEADDDRDLGRAARCNLAAWSPSLVRRQAMLTHNSWVWSVAFSPDGRTLATGSYDRTARLWEADGKPCGKPLPHRYSVWSVAFNSDGKMLLTGSGDNSGGEGRLWDASNGQLLASWPHPSQVLSAVFNPAARTCLTVSVEEAIVRSIPDGKPVGQAMKHPRPPHPLPGFLQPLIGAFSPDGKLVVTAGEDGTVRFWDAATGQAKSKTLRTAAPIQAIAFSPDGHTLLTGCVDGSARMWDVANGQPCSPILRHRGMVQAVAFSPDGKIAATAGSIQEVNLRAQKINIVGGEVRLWKAPTGETFGTPLAHPATVRSLAFSPTGRRLLTGSQGSDARIFLVATGEQMGKGLEQNGTIPQVAFSPDGTRLLVAAAGSGSPIAALLWRLAPEDHLPRLLLHNDFIRVLNFSPDNRLLVSAGDDNHAQLWDVATGKPQGPPLPHDHSVYIAVFSPDGQSLFTSSEGQVQRDGRSVIVSDTAFWDVKTGRRRTDVRSPHRIFNAAFCDDGRTLLIGDIEGNLQPYDASTGKPLGTPLKHNASVSSLEMGSDGRTVLTSDGRGGILWDWSTRRQLKRFSSEGSVLEAHFYPDKNGLLLVENGFAKIWDRASGQRRSSPLFHAEGGIRQLMFGPDGRNVLIRDNENNARLSDVATGKLIGPAPGRTGVASIAFSPNGRCLAVGSKDGRLALWETPQPMQGSCERLRLWIEVGSGMEIDPQQIIRPLSPDEVQKRRLRLDELGGAPNLFQQ